MTRLRSFIAVALVWATRLVCADALCGGTFKSNYGEITSPNYPSSYGSNLSCVWTIEGAIGSRLVIGFKYFFLEYESDCRNDYIQIEHGNVTPIRYCGATVPDRMITKGPNATILFVTNDVYNLPGVHLDWKVFTEPVPMANPVLWESANAECELNGGQLMEPDPDYIDTYRDNIIDWTGAYNVSDIWVRKYFTPWVFLKGCIREYFVDPKRTFTVKNNQQIICQNLCSGYNYFGLKRNKCSCLNDFAPMYDICSFRCEGNTDELCGGGYSYTVYKNNICYTSSTSWIGTLTKHIRGTPCLSWNKTAFMNSSFPDGSAADAKDYCRDPDGSGGPWCFNSSTSGTRYRCDVYECLDMSAKQNGSSECIAILKYDTRFTGLQMPCSTSFSGVYFDSKLRRNEIVGSWNYVRNIVNQYSLWFPFPPQYQDIYQEGTFYWTGLSRNTSTLRPLAAPSECFKLQWSKHILKEEPVKCNIQLPFICQKVPVNCGQSYIQTEDSINFTEGMANYGNDMNCEWRIEGFDNTFICVDISFDIEDCLHCECDSLKIYDVPMAIGQPNKTLCGVGLVTFNSTQKAVTLTYSSDRSVQEKGFQAKWVFVPLPSSATTPTPIEITRVLVTSRTGSEDVTQRSPKKLSAGLIGGIVAALVVSTASVIVCVVVTWRKKEPRKKHGDSKNANLEVEVVTSNNENGDANDIYSVSAKVKIRNGMDSVEYGVVKKRPISNQVTSTQNIPITLGRESNIEGPSPLDGTGRIPTHHGYDSIENVHEDANNDGEYNRLNELLEPEYINRIDNVYNHVQGTDNDAYDHTTDAQVTSDTRASYSHVRGPFPTSKPPHDAENNASNSLF